jgi:hypothetical protein
MKKLAFVFALLACLACLAPTPAEAATTSKVTVTNTAWTSLGAGPLVLTFRGDGVYAVSDTIPVGSSPPLAEGLKVPAGTSVVVNTASNVWAMSSSPLGVDVYYAPVAAASGGSLTWPGTAALTNFGTAPTGTVPGVNASIFQNATSSPLTVNCTIGCAGGTFNNNADAVATSATNGQSASWSYGFNGTTWDRLRVDGSKNLLVAAIQSGTWTVQPGNTANTTPWLVNEGQIGGVNVNMGTGASSTGTQRVATSTDSPGGAAANPSFSVPQAATTGGATPAIQSALTTPVVVKASAGQVYKIQCDNLAGSANAWVELINAASSPALGTTVLDQVALPIGGTGGFALAVGEVFGTGISIGAATASNGNTAVSTAVNCSVAYK